jgi:GNAT superfamily N-acetyltransferase
VTTFQIRDAEAGDMAALRDVFRRSSLSNDGDRADLLSHPELLEFGDLSVLEGRTRAAVSDGVVAGFATWLRAGDAVELEDLFVDPQWMRRGAGRALVADIAEIARGRGVSRVEVTANEHARAFYAEVGFVVDSQVQTTFGPALRMHLDLE